MQRVVFLLAIIITTWARAGNAQVVRYSFEQLDSLQRQEPRPVMVFIHTDWCAFCAAMENTTLQDPRVVELLTTKFYFIDLNAEKREAIKVGEQTFRYKPTGGTTGLHELAEQLGTVEGTVSYPTLCFLTSAYEITFQYNQFIDAPDLIMVLEKLISS